jgi:hypothetical protein
MALRDAERRTGEPRVRIARGTLFSDNFPVTDNPPGIHLAAPASRFVMNPIGAIRDSVRTFSDGRLSHMPSIAKRRHGKGVAVSQTQRSSESRRVVSLSV